MSHRHILMFVLCLTVVTGCSREQAGPPARPVMVTQPEPASGPYLVFSGEVRAREQPDLAFRVGGRILRRLVEVGDRVESGQVLAELDPADFDLQGDAAEAGLHSARSELALAQAEHDRYRSLLEGRLVSRSDYDARENRLEAAQSRLRQAQSEHQVARNQSGYTALRAPADGVIVARRAEAGQVVAAGQPVLVLAVAGEREIAISLPEHDVAGYRIGQPVEVELWARPGRRHAGRIRELAPEADPRTRTFAARIAFDAEAAGAELGQSARVLVSGAASRALSVPLPALAQFDQQPFVWVVEPESLVVRKTPVALQSFDENSAIIGSGLAADAWVVIAGVSLLEDGQRVLPVSRDNLPLSLAESR